MQLRLPWTARRSTPSPRAIVIDGRPVPVEIHRRKGSRRYIVRVTPEGRVRLTVPYGATTSGGLEFAEGQSDWISKELARLQEVNAPWSEGTLVWLRGDQVPIRVSDGHVRVGDEVECCAAGETNLRPPIVRELRELAADELPERCLDLADRAGRLVRRVSVRNQQSRWGACSARGTITLNWRLVQVPLEVRDYVILHELAHLTVPNHSPQFWREVERLCLSWRDCEDWLREHESQIF